jgi:hypothetical protein
MSFLVWIRSGMSNRLEAQVWSEYLPNKDQERRIVKGYRMEEGERDLPMKALAKIYPCPEDQQ